MVIDGQLEERASCICNDRHRRLEEELATTDNQAMTDHLQSQMEIDGVAETDNESAVIEQEVIGPSRSAVSLSMVLFEQTPGLSSHAGAASGAYAVALKSIPHASPETANVALPTFPIRFTRGTSAESLPERTSTASNLSMGEATGPRSSLADIDVAYVTEVMNLAEEWQATYRHLLGCTAAETTSPPYRYAKTSAKDARIARWCNFAHPTGNRRRRQSVCQRRSYQRQSNRCAS